MKVFFSGSYKGDEEYHAQYENLFNEIKKLGYEHVDDEIVKMSYDQLATSLSKNKEAYKTHYNKKIDAIRKADICIFEASHHSLGVGFLIQRALDESKPTLVFYFKDNVPFFLSGIENDKIIIKSYSDSNYKQVLKKALTDAREKRDKRFNFFLSPKLLNYLEEVSKKQGVTKSKILRDLILAHMRQT